MLPFKPWFSHIALVCLIALFSACGGDEDELGTLTEEGLIGITADRVQIRFDCTVIYTADISSSDAGKEESVRQFLKEAVLQVTLMLQSSDIFSDDKLLGKKIEEQMTDRTESAPSTTGLYTFSVTCSDAK